MSVGDVTLGPADANGLRVRSVCVSSTLGEGCTMIINSNGRAPRKAAGGKEIPGKCFIEGNLGDDVSLIDGDEYDGVTWDHPMFSRFIQNHPDYTLLFKDLPPRVTPDMLRNELVAKYWIESWTDLKLRPLAAACVANMISDHMYM